MTPCPDCFEKAIESCQNHPPLKTAIVHPVRDPDIEVVVETHKRV